MKDIRYIWRGAALSLALSLMAAGCSMSDDLECPPEQGTSGSAVSGPAYVQLSFSTAANGLTRANPNGGEQGDGSEAGQTYENAVSSAVAFLFAHNDDGVNAANPAEVTVTPVRFGKVTGNGQTYTTVAQKVGDIDYGQYDVIVVANPGDDNWWSSVSTLKDLQDKIMKTAWTQNADGTYTDFLMASADDAVTPLNVTEDNTTEANAAKTAVSVERVAARVDYNAEGKYTCTDDNYKGATVEITGATIVNRLTAGSYLLKRTADDAQGTNLEYLGLETATGDDMLATNYVLDPWTADKTEANLQGTPFIVDGQNVAAAGLYDADTYIPYIPTRSTNPKTWDELVKPGTPVTDASTTDGIKEWQRVGYALENTTDRLSTSLNYNTGIVFKAQFHPVGVDGYTDGQTFFTYNGVIYPTLTDMMGQLNEIIEFNSFGNLYIERMLDWNQLKDSFVSKIKNDPTGYRDYLLKIAEGKDDEFAAITSQELEQLKWTYYLNNVLGVVEDSQNGPQINQNNINNTRALLYESSNKLLRTYYKGQCYYTWWLRHCNDGNDETNGVMEYAIVRNNIYKVRVNSIYSLGGDIPDNEQLDARVYVNKWSMLDPEVLPM